jgi:hypothetical protein
MTELLLANGAYSVSVGHPAIASSFSVDLDAFCSQLKLTDEVIGK